MINRKLSTEEEESKGTLRHLVAIGQGDGKRGEARKRGELARFYELRFS